MNRLDIVRKLANRKTKQYALQPPINLQFIFKKMNIRIVEEENQYGIEAYSILDIPPTIYINPEMTFYGPRKNFTLAHELGHICIPWHNGDIKCNPDDCYIKVEGKRLLDSQELEANVFASELLMPQDWLISNYEKYKELPFDELIKNISKNANTSIIATLYAIEQILPSGYCYLAKNKNTNSWFFFTSKNTFTVNWRINYDDFSIIENLSLSKETYAIGPYSLLYYKMAYCPDKNNLHHKLEKNDFNINSLIEEITFGVKVRLLPFIDVFFKSIAPSRFAVHIYDNHILIKSIYDKEGPLSKLYGNLGSDRLENILITHGFKFEFITMEDDILVLYIEEKKFQMPHLPFTNPNTLLKNICKSLNYNEHLHKSINGIMSYIYSSNKNKSYSVEELYNLSKYRFITDLQFTDFVSHHEFDNYIVNKLISMLNKKR